jgi:hypothetical protein
LFQAFVHATQVVHHVRHGRLYPIENSEDFPPSAYQKGIRFARVSKMPLENPFSDSDIQSHDISIEAKPAKAIAEMEKAGRGHSSRQPAIYKHLT